MTKVVFEQSSYLFPSCAFEKKMVNSLVIEPTHLKIYLPWLEVKNHGQKPWKTNNMWNQHLDLAKYLLTTLFGE